MVKGSNYLTVSKPDKQSAQWDNRLTLSAKSVGIKKTWRRDLTAVKVLSSPPEKQPSMAQIAENPIDLTDCEEEDQEISKQISKSHEAKQNLKDQI